MCDGEINVVVLIIAQIPDLSVSGKFPTLKNINNNHGYTQITRPYS